MSVLASAAKATFKSYQAIKNGTKQVVKVAEVTGLDKVCGITANTALYTLFMPPHKFCKLVDKKSKQFIKGKKAGGGGGSQHFNPVTKQYED